MNAVDAIGAAESGAPAAGLAAWSSSSTARSTPAGAARLVVADDGPGIEEDLLARGGPFFTTKEQGKGTGLGLAIVHNIVAAHGGRVLLEGRPGSDSG